MIVTAILEDIFEHVHRAESKKTALESFSYKKLCAVHQRRPEQSVNLNAQSGIR